MLDILYFAWVREGVGESAEQIDPPAGLNVGEMIDWLRARSPAHDVTLADPSRLRAALDQRFVPLDAPIGQARELAIFPPVTGG